MTLDDEVNVKLAMYFPIVRLKDFQKGVNVLHFNR